jgi:hypothetical protein
MKRMKVRIAEVFYRNKGKAEYEVVARDKVRARDLIIKYFGPEAKWKNIQVRTTLENDDGSARVIDKHS